MKTPVALRAPCMHTFFSWQRQENILELPFVAGYRGRTGGLTFDCQSDVAAASGCSVSQLQERRCVLVAVFFISSIGTTRLCERAAVRQDRNKMCNDAKWPSCVLIGEEKVGAKAASGLPSLLVPCQPKKVILFGPVSWPSLLLTDGTRTPCGRDTLTNRCRWFDGRRHRHRGRNRKPSVRCPLPTRRRTCRRSGSRTIQTRG